MNGLDKIRPEHKERRAFVYARQSTMAQLVKNHTSTERQMGLTGLAVALGWPPSQVELLAEDLGRSGRFSENRDDFQRLTAEVGLGRAGAVLSLDASRLARSSADWYRLIEIAALTRTLLVDEQTVYDPRDPNDRLILGMKGTMADFELVWLRQRMDGGRWHLARQGEFRSFAPAGYVYDGNHLVMDPDEEVRRAVALVFERYRVAASCRDVVQYLATHKLSLPCRPAGRLCFRPPTVARIKAMLHNPAYAGAYVYGRRYCETILEAGKRRERIRWRPASEWPVVLRGAHAEYISWDEYMANQKRLSNSAPRPAEGAGSGAPRNGSALFVGLLLCGRCGSRLRIHYRGTGGRYPAYQCNQADAQGTGTRCLCLSLRSIEAPVVELVLSMLTREELVAASQVMELVEEEDANLTKQWALRVERARYEATRAERQYDACDPENRVVARTLETRWNDKLVELQKLEREQEAAKGHRRLMLTDLDRRRILELADDLPRLWRATTTTDRDRKMLLRLLVQQVSITPIEVPQRVLQVRVLWHTQAVTELEIDRFAPGGHQRSVSWRVVKTTTPTLPATN